MHLAHELDGHLELLGGFEQLVVSQARDLCDLGVDEPHVADGLHDVARSGLAFRADHRRALCNAAQRLAQIACSAYERHLELRLVDVVDVVGGGEDLGLVDVVDVDRLEHLCLDEVADAALRHDGDAHGLLDAANHRGVAHAAHATGGTDVGGDALERHDGARARLLCDFCLLWRGHVHNHASLEHLGKLAVELDAFGGAGGLFVHVLSPSCLRFLPERRLRVNWHLKNAQIHIK